MPAKPSQQRSATESHDDFDDDATNDAGISRQQGRETLRMLALDLLGRWYWIALGLVLGILGAAYYLSKTPKQYSATATLLVKERNTSVMANDKPEEINMASPDAMNTVVARISRLDLLERVASRQNVRALPGLVPAPVDWTPAWLAEKFGKNTATAAPAQAPPSPAALGAMISGCANVSVRRYTRLVDITVVHQMPEVAKAFADNIAQEYLADVSTTRSEGRSDAIDLLQKQSMEARTSLQSARGSLALYTRALEVHRNLDLKETEVNALRRRYLPKHPKMVTAVAELVRLQQNFLSEFTVARSAANEKSYWDAAGKDLPDQASAPEEYLRIARQQLLARVGVLDSEIQSSTSVFNSMLTRIEETSVNQESTASNVEISNLARIPSAPSAPVADKIIAKGAGGGLAAGLLLALLLCRFDNKYHTVAEIAADTGETILAAIANVPLRHLAVAARGFHQRHPDTKLDFHEDWDPHLLFRPGVSATSYAEMYRVLRASVSLLGDETLRKITVFSSALPSEGKTVISANFALAAAGQGRRTLLIDLDLRKPNLHHLFGREREPSQGGATECLAGHLPFAQVVIRETGVENLHIILSGKRAPNPGELLSTGRLKVLLAEACALYDVVVIDTAPILAVPDTRIIAPFADNFCLVCRAEYVPKGAVRHVLNILAEDGTSLSGIIFNGFLEKRRRIGQNFSYGYYQSSRYGNAFSYRYNNYGAYGSDDDDQKPTKRKRKINNKFPDPARRMAPTSHT